MKILITAGKSALALKIAKAFETHQVIIADYGEMPNFSSSLYKFISLGEKNEDTTAHSLLNICLNEAIDWILPLHAFEVIAMTKAKVLFNEFNIDIILPSIEEIANFFNANNNLAKVVNWAAFKEGVPLFMSTPNEQLVSFAENISLSGVFCFNEVDAVANLTLITI